MIRYPSIVQNMDAAEYHEAPALNASTISKMVDCPAMAFASLWKPSEPTESMKIGTLVHSLVLEPETVPGKYYVLTEPGTTKAGKAQKAEAAEKGMDAVSKTTFDTASNMAQAVREHPAIGKLLAFPGESELSLFWRDEDHDIECKARIDRLVRMTDSVRVALDIKTAVSANPRDIGRKVVDFGYHRQAAWYLHGLKEVGVEAASFVFCFVRNSYPHLVSAVVLSEDALRKGWTDCDAAMIEWAECVQTQTWPAYPEEIVTVDLPPWAYR